MVKRLTASVGLVLILACVAAIAYFVFASPYRLYIVHTGSMEPTIPTRSAVIVHTGEYHVGEPVSFIIHGETVTHRLIRLNHDGTITTKGDANRSADPWHADRRNIIGGVVLAPRYLGWTLFFFRQPTGVLSFCLIGIGAWLLWTSDEAPPRHRAEPVPVA